MIACKRHWYHYTVLWAFCFVFAFLVKGEEETLARLRQQSQDGISMLRCFFNSS